MSKKRNNLNFVSYGKNMSGSRGGGGGHTPPLYRLNGRSLRYARLQKSQVSISIMLSEPSDILYLHSIINPYTKSLKYNKRYVGIFINILFLFLNLHSI